jgi:hypothetical protein
MKYLEINVHVMKNGDCQTAEAKNLADTKKYIHKKLSWALKIK